MIHFKWKVERQYNQCLSQIHALLRFDTGLRQAFGALLIPLTIPDIRLVAYISIKY